LTKRYDQTNPTQIQVKFDVDIELLNMKNAKVMTSVC